MRHRRRHLSRPDRHRAARGIRHTCRTARPIPAALPTKCCRQSPRRGQSNSPTSMCFATTTRRWCISTIRRQHGWRSSGSGSRRSSTPGSLAPKGRSRRRSTLSPHLTTSKSRSSGCCAAGSRRRCCMAAPYCGRSRQRVRRFAGSRPSAPSIRRCSSVARATSPARVDLWKDAAERGAPFLIVVGASGSGKSSLARAGLVPRLTVPGVVPAVDAWRVAAMRPTELPQGPVRHARNPAARWRQRDPGGGERTPAGLARAGGERLPHPGGACRAPQPCRRRRGNAAAAHARSHR